MKLFSVYDSKSKHYSNPTIYRTPGEAQRAFHGTCQDESSSFAKFPEDFTLVQIGAFDPDNGSVMPEEKPIILCNASELTKH